MLYTHLRASLILVSVEIKRIVASVLVSIAWIGLSCLPASSQQTGGVLILRRANLFDGISSRPRRGVTVVVRGRRIVRVSSRSLPTPAGARVIDLAGKWLLPGLIDAHVHLRDADSAMKALSSGVTTARSLGGPHFIDLELRERHRNGAIELPDILGAGYHVRRRLASEFFIDVPRLKHIEKGLDGPRDVQLAVGALTARAVDVVKVMATERAGQVDTDPLKRVLSNVELAAAVAEAGKARLPVAAHAHTDDGARAAVLAGARTIEHGTLVAEATLRLMRKRGVCLVPTIAFWKDMAEPGGEYDDPKLAERGQSMLPRIRHTIALARQIGVTVAAGSDMRYDAKSILAMGDEIAELVAAGMSFGEAIRAATSASAKCLGIAARTGAVIPGLDADLIVVETDPRLNIDQLRAPSLVINNGRIALDRLSKIH